ETIPPGTPGTAGDGLPVAGETMAQMMAPTPLSVRALLELRAHLRQHTHRWNPKMKPFIFGERNGIHIVDLDQTRDRFEDALDFVRETTAAGGKVLFVGTKQTAALPVPVGAGRSSPLFVNH